MRPIIMLVSLITILPVAAESQVVDTLQLKLERAVWLESDGALNLSGLALGDDGYLYFSDDNGPAPIGWRPQNPFLLRIAVDKVLDLDIEMPALEALHTASDTSWAHLAHSAGKMHKYDVEGIAAAAGGKLWLTDERDRLLIEYDPSGGRTKLIAGYRELSAWHEQLAGGGINNGFEGVALMDGKLFLANEMFPGLIVRYGLESDQAPVAEEVFQIEGNHDITGLESSEGALYALGRTASLVYRLDPDNGRVTAVAGFGAEGNDNRYRYRQRRDYFRNSEGLAVGSGRIFIVLDGNFQPNLADDQQRRPLLLIYRCPDGF